MSALEHASLRAGEIGIERSDVLQIPVGKKMFEIEKTIILATLERFRYNRTKTAKSLGIGIRTLQRRLKDYDFIQLESVS